MESIGYFLLKGDSMYQKDFEIAKKIAKKRIKTAGEVKHIKDHSGNSDKREHLEGFNFNEKGLKAVAETYNHLAKAFSNMVQASNSFNKIKSSQVSPDGRIGGTGYVQQIKDVRTAMSSSINVISELIDTFYDEVNSPYWKKQTFEEHPIVKSILNEADLIIDKAEEKADIADKELKENK